MEQKYSLKVAYLYPKLLNLYGDYGNIIALQKRCEWRGISIEIDNIDINARIDPNLYDLFFLGGGQDSQQREVAKELLINRESLKQAAEENKVFLAICGGYQLLGEYYQTLSDAQIQGIGLLDIYTVASFKRLISNMVTKSAIITPNTLVGFENHSGQTFIKPNTQTKPLANVLIGFGNNGIDKTEGARKLNVFGTYLHGALLPKNPHFADYLITLALQNKYKNFEINLEKLDDNIELETHQKLLNKKF